MKKSLLLLILSSLSLLSYSQSWLFPIYFEDSIGQRDTVYFGYHPLATFGLDTAFGEKIIAQDTSKFYAYFLGLSQTSDSVLKKIIIPDVSGLNGLISFNKGLLPVKIYWDGNLFDSDSLPFIKQNSLPRAMGSMEKGNNVPPNGCAPLFPIIMSNDSSACGFCIRSDSVVFSQGVYKYIQEIAISIVSFKDQSGCMGINNVSSDIYFDVYPNPVSNLLHIESKLNDNYSYKLFDVYGRLVKTVSDIRGNQIINTVALVSGAYILTINDLQGLPLFTNKIIIYK